jgi:hypothetical protein
MARSLARPVPVVAREHVVWLCFIVCAVAAIFPIVLATARAINDNWVPVGDDAFYVIRARDVFNQHRPLLGTWTSASLTVGIDLNNPGPLFFDALAVPVTLWGGDAGVAVGAALVNALSVIGIAVVAYRRGGAVIGSLAMLVSAVLLWTMGSDLLFDPWQPHTLVLPFLCFLMLVWSCTCGDLVALPWTLAVGSLVVQTHLSYALLVPALAVLAVAALAVSQQRVRERDPAMSRAAKARTVRYGVISTVVLAACWLQPLAEQFFGEGTGNMTRLARSFGDSGVETAGARYATQSIASVLSLPPWWFRPSFNETLIGPEGWNPPPLSIAITSLVIVAAACGFCFWWAWKRRDRLAVCALAVAALGLAVGFATVARAPVTIFGKLTPHSSRWLWSLVAFLTFAVAISLLRPMARRSREVPIALSLTGMTLLFAVLNVPSSPTVNGPNTEDWSQAATRSLRAQLEPLENKGPLLVDDLFTTAFDPYGAAVLAELQRRDIAFVAASPGLVRQLGPERRYDGTNAGAELLMRTGAAATAPVDGAERVALHAPVAPERDAETVALFVRPLGRDGE